MCEFVAYLSDTHVMHGVDATDLYAMFDCVTRDAFICVSLRLIWGMQMSCTALMLLICKRHLSAWLVTHTYVWVRGLFESHRTVVTRSCYCFTRNIWVRDFWRIHTCDLFEWHRFDMRRWCCWFTRIIWVRAFRRIHMCGVVAHLSHTDVVFGVDATDSYATSEFVTRDAFIFVGL